MRAILLALEILAFGGNEKMTVNHSPQLYGETVTVSYVTDPSISYGQFRLENPGTDAIIVGLKSAWLEVDGQQQSLDEISLFDTDQDKMINPENFKVGAKSTLSFLIGFPRQEHVPQSGELIAVHLQLTINGLDIQSLSPIKFEKRIPVNR